MNLTSSLYVQIILRILGVVVLYTLMRLVFFGVYYPQFSDISFIELLYTFWVGLRFDFSSIMYTNALFMLLSLIPSKLRDYKGFYILLFLSFIIPNCIALAFSWIDMGYFSVVKTRSTSDILFMLLEGGDLMYLLPRYLIDYWYYLICWIGTTVMLVWYFYKTEPLFFKIGTPESTWWQRWLFLCILIVCVVTGMRGGWQLKPITIVSAGKYAEPKHIPLVLNTPFSILMTFEHSKLEELTYFSPKQCQALYSPIHSYPLKPFKKHNVMVLLVESLGQEYIGLLNGGKGYTPFLDSLMQEGLLFDHAYANGLRSIESVPAVFASMPTLMPSAYITSSYGTNQLSSLPNLLGEKGYSSAFFHGGNNGSMNFDQFAGLMGFDSYHGRNEYNNDADHDGHWGIYDEPFLQYVIKQTSKMPEPFINGVFTISSHHPYTIPKQHKHRFVKGELPIHPTIQYTDYALKQFFKEAKKQPWFENTLFIITADHTSISNSSYYQNRVGKYRIPIFFYKPNEITPRRDHCVAQQIDIMSTVLDFLGYDDSFFSFGTSLLGNKKSIGAVSYDNGHYQLITSTDIIEFDGQNIIEAFSLPSDSLIQYPITPTYSTLHSANQLKALIQTYRSCLNNNALTKDNYLKK